MTHNGADYALVSDPAARDATRVLLPEKENNGYQVSLIPVNHVLQFQQVVHIQATASRGISKSSAQVLLDTTSATKAPKPKPKGLKMRFRPSGFGDGDLGVIGSSDEEDVPAPAAFRRPALLPNGAGPAKKRKEHDDTPLLEMAEKNKKKKKDRSNVQDIGAEESAQKNEKYAAEATTAIEADQDTAPPEATGKEGKKKKRKEKHGVAVAEVREAPDVPLMGDVPDTEEIQAVKEAKDNNKEKKRNEKKSRVTREGGADVVMQNSLAEVGQSGEVVEGSKEKKKKKDKKNKAVEQDVSAAALNGGPAEPEGDASEKKRKKKDKKEKKRRAEAGEA
jgi:hypothetical protein